MHGGSAVSAGAAACPRLTPRRAADAGRSAPPAVRAAPRGREVGQALTERAVPAARPHSRRPAAAGPWTRPPGPLPPRARPASQAPGRRGSLRSVRPPLPPRPAAAANGSEAPRALPGRGGAGSGRGGGGSTRGCAERSLAPTRSAALPTNGSGELQLTKKRLGQWESGAGQSCWRQVTVGGEVGRREGTSGLVDGCRGRGH